SEPARTTSNVLPWITNIDVVPEKYSSGSLPAHGGKCAGSAVARGKPSLPASSLASSAAGGPDDDSARSVIPWVSRRGLRRPCAPCPCGRGGRPDRGP